MDDIRGEEEVLLQRRWGSCGAIDLVERSESRGSPDDEAAKMTARCELEEIEGEDRGSFHAWNVAERTNKFLAIFMRVVDDQWPTSLTVTTTSELSLAGT